MVMADRATQSSASKTHSRNPSMSAKAAAGEESSHTTPDSFGTVAAVMAAKQSVPKFVRTRLDLLVTPTSVSEFWAYLTGPGVL